jgi:hypothetical protein
VAPIARLLSCLLALFALAGCGSSNLADPPEGPELLAPVKTEASSFGNTKSTRVNTPHYRMDTTIENEELVDRLAQVMEGALSQYRKLAPDVPLSSEPLQCYVFANRNQWAQFTEHETGADAKVYLRINRGGYSVRDWYVSYYIGERETISVASHEGFHQYVGRNFKRRPPPFVEEGLATLFEFVDWDKDLPRWRIATNPNRLAALERALKQGNTMPLGELCAMHAGQVVSKQLWKVEMFYAQAWGFARFLMDGENGRYRPALQRMLTDLANDRALIPNAGPGPGGLWNPATARPLLEKYLDKNIEEIDREYQAFLRKIVAEQYGKQR